jgi:hypothetical protein
VVHGGECITSTMRTDTNEESAGRKNVTVIGPGDTSPEEFDASILLSGRESCTAEFLTAITDLWTGDGILAVFNFCDHAGEIRDEARLHWGDRTDLVLLWDPNAEDATRALDESFGRWADSGRAVIGTPANSTGDLCRDYPSFRHIPTAGTVRGMAELAIARIGRGARRSGPHRNVPLMLWQTPSFQTWLTTQETAGNELRDGRMLWNYRVGPQQNLVFFWAFESFMWIQSEQRENIAEVVLGRPDISSVVAYHPAPTLADTEVVIVREFRAPSVSHDGFVRELPGGSAYTPSSTTIDDSPILDQGITELREETGIDLHPARFRMHQTRQLAATVSAHQQHVLSVELTPEEVAKARADRRPHGVAADSERTYIEVHRYADLVNQRLVDWTTLGAITAVLLDRVFGLN